MEKIWLAVGIEEEGERVDAVLAENSVLSRTRIQKIIKEGLLEINNKVCTKPSTILTSGDRVELRIPEAQPYYVKPENIPLDIIHEDGDILIINKPAGLVVHPGAGNPDGTVVNAVLYHCPDLSGIGGELRPGIVHRLDKDTSGLMVIAKNDFSHISLSAQFASRAVKRHYLALAEGHFSVMQGEVRAGIARDDRNKLRMTVSNHGRDALTYYSVIKEYQNLSLLDAQLHTGRTHQIRVHLAYLKHPVMGDQLYGSRIPYPEGQFLHAWKLGFYHPRTQRWMSFYKSLPKNKKDYLIKLNKELLN